MAEEPKHETSRPAGVDEQARSALASACERVGELADDAVGVDGVRPSLVVGPTDVDQVAEVMRVSRAHDLAVVARGRGPKLSWGRAPERCDVLLDLSALDQVLDHAAGDLIVATQAGATLAGVQEVVAKGEQRLCLDETVPGGTIGGALATNASGPRRVLAGTPRDLLIGLTVVRADGVVAKAGGRVVKNVAGYDLGKLVVGSYGTLAVVVDATFRLHPLPAASRWVAVEVADAEAAQAAAQAAVHSQVVPAAVEVEWSTSTRQVAVLLEGRPDGVEGRAAELRSLLGSGAHDLDAPPAGGATYPWGEGTGETALKLTCALSGVGEVLAEAERVGAHVRGSAGAGVLHAALPAGTAVGDVASATERLRAVCTRRGGATVVLDAPAEVKQAVDTWGPVPALRLMQRVKAEFDPDRRLAPGRFVGGI